MEKKTYTAPQMQIVAVGPQMLLSDSLNMDDTNHVTNSGSVYSRRFNNYDDSDE